MIVTTETVLSGGQPVGTEIFQPESSGKHPAVLILHGTFGLLPPFCTDIVSFPEALVANGFSGVMPHYFDATKTVPGIGVLEQIPMHLPAWRSVCYDVFSFMASDSRFEAGHLGAIGFSLGGHLALSLAMALPSGMAIFGPTLNPSLEGKFTSLPPVLIQHGTDDPIVSQSESVHLVNELNRAGKKKDVDYFFQFYEGEGHGFKEPALTKSRNMTLEFVGKFL
jgi:dienelactone hydrolase